MTGSIDIAFVHGGGQGGWVWDETRAAIALQAGAAVRTIAIDMPGCGARRGADLAGLRVRDVADAIVADLDAAGLRDVLLVGHSNAGTLLPIVAAARPDLIRALVYVSCIAPPSGVSIRTLRQAEHDALPADPAARWRAMFCNDMAADAADAFMARMGEDRWPTVAALDETDWAYDHLATIPASYVVCLRDRALPPSAQMDYADRLHARAISLDAGHQAMNTRPHALAEILLATAADLGATPPPRL